MIKLKLVILGTLLVFITACGKGKGQPKPPEDDNVGGASSIVLGEITSIQQVGDEQTQIWIRQQ